MCMKKIYDNLNEPHEDHEIIFDRFIETASEAEISRFANDKCKWCPYHKTHLCKATFS